MNNNTLRLFIAIAVPEEVKRQIQRVQSDLRLMGGARVAWPRVEGIHLTLKFLGDIEEGRVGQVASAVKRCCESAKPMKLSTTGFGGFPNLRRPRVLWWGVAEKPELLNLQSELEAALEDAGCEPEPRRFHPHLTIGRVKSIDPHAPIVSAFQELHLPEVGWRVGEVLVMSSDLQPTGAVYKAVASCRLGA